MDRDAGISRAYRAFAQGRRQEAISALRQILRSAPDDPAALTLLGRMSLADNEPLAALQAFERVLRAHGDAATAWLDLARTLRELNNHAQALTAVHRAIDIDARRAGGWLLLGDLHLDLGDLAAARTAFLRARVLEPANVGALRGLARCDAPGPDDALTARMLDLVDAPATPERDRALLHYALAQVYRQAGLAEPFQQHLLQANRIQRSFTPGTREDYAAVFDRIEACLDAQALDRLPAASPGVPVPLFILGMPRSGTSLVEQLMAADPGVVAGGEINYARGPLVRAVEQRTGRAFPDGVGELSDRGRPDVGEDEDCSGRWGADCADVEQLAALLGLTGVVEVGGPVGVAALEHVRHVVVEQQQVAPRSQRGHCHGRIVTRRR